MTLDDEKICMRFVPEGLSLSAINVDGSIDRMNQEGSRLRDLSHIPY